MHFRDKWIQQMASSIRVSGKYNKLTDEQLLTYLNKIFDKHFKDHSAVIYNDYEEEIMDTTLAGCLDWIQVENPTIAESGVFFHQKSKMRNVNVEIIKEDMLDARTIHKKEMFEARKAGDFIKEMVKRNQQLNDKKAANSGYGAEGESSSFLYNPHSAMSVTASGRGQLSTAGMCVENLLADFVKFMNMDEFFVYITNILSDKPTWQFDEYDVIDIIPTKAQFLERMQAKFKHSYDFDEKLIGKVWDNLSAREQIRVYYKSNIRDFLLNKKIKLIYKAIIECGEPLIDPNDVPNKMMKWTTLLTDLTTEFVNYKHGVFRYEDRMKFEKRAVVIVSDTDSVFLYLGALTNFIIDNVAPKMGKMTKEEFKTFKITIINTLCCISSTAIAARLWNYLETVRVAEDDRKYIKMKNEFYNETVIVTYAMKSYIALQMRQEADVFEKPLLDVKGVNFFKSTSSEKTTKFIYDDVLMEQLLQPKDGKIRLDRVISTIYAYQQKMEKEIASGDMGYLKRSIKVKSPDGYSKPMSIGQYKAVWVWNKICEQKDLIELPATVTLVKVKASKPADIACLAAEYPDIYEKLMYLFENEVYVGGGKIIEKKDGVEVEKKIAMPGIKAIALPVDYDEVPEWMLKIIDVETLVNDNLRLFSQLFRPLGLVPSNASHNGSSLTYYSNIVRI